MNQTDSSNDIGSSDSTPTPTPAPAPSPARVSKAASGPANPFCWGTGRRKTAVARVRIRPGEGKFLINDRKVDAFFRIDKDREAVRMPLSVTESADTFDIFVNIRGGGTTGQAGAVVLGLARALVRADSKYEPKLREHRLLTRDARKVERKKYGQRGARRRFQFSKR